MATEARQGVEVARLCAKVIATPIFVFSFGFMWLGFLLFLGPLFRAFSFLMRERFSWKEHLAECNEFFCEPLRKMWCGSREVGAGR
jgi:hypothetical protein